MASDAEDRVTDWWESFLRGAETGVRTACQDILEESKAIIADEAIDRGTLLNSTEAADSVLRVSRLHYQAKWTAEHAIYINYGTGPGHHPDPRGNYMPPFEVILAWVKRNARLLASITLETGDDELDAILEPDEVALTAEDSPRALIKAKRQKGQRLRKLPDAAARRLARAIQRKIFLRGTEPVLFAERARDAVMPRFQTLLEEGVRRELQAWERRGRIGGET